MAALRLRGEDGAAGTRPRRSCDPNSHSSPPTSRPPLAARLSPQAGRNWLAAEINWSSSSGDELKAEAAQEVLPRRLDDSPLQAAGISRPVLGENSRRSSPRAASPYQLVVPVVAFYSKEKTYLTPLERKELKESCFFPEGPENLPVSSKTGKTNPNWSRSPRSQPSQRAPASTRGKTLPKRLKKSKGGAGTGKKVVGKENVNSLVQKKMDSPFRVLSMKVKPALKLPAGAAFFCPAKKPHSKKPPLDVKPLQLLPKTPPGNHQPGPAEVHSAGGTKLLKPAGVSKGVLVNESRVESPRCEKEEGDPTLGGKSSPGGGNSSPRGAGSSSGAFCPSQPAATGSEDLGEMGSSPSCQPQPVHPPSHSPPEVDKPAPPPSAVVYPIFTTAPSSKKRPQASADELGTAPFGSTKAPQASQKSKKVKELGKHSWDQMIIDAGQKHFGAISCRSCGMIYAAASPEDEAQHIQHHQRLLEGLRYLGWKKERVVAEFWDGKIVLILPSDPRYAVKKAEDVREIVDNELGFKQVALSSPDKTKIYLFVANERMVVGCVVAESIKKAFRVLSEPVAELESPGQGSLEQQEQQRAWRCSSEPEAAACGISRIWVLGPRRGKGIARRMVDVVRSTFIYGCILSPREIAFSDPTPAGRAFATHYCQTPNFLVYNFLYSH